jgi:hypothetical protein
MPYKEPATEVEIHKIKEVELLWDAKYTKKER